MPRVTDSASSKYSAPLIEELGFSRFHRRDDVDLEQEIDLTLIPQMFPDNAFGDDKIESLSVGKLKAGSIGVDEFIESSNFETGVSGWRILGDGTAEFQNGTFRGAIEVGAGGTIGGFDIGNDYIRDVLNTFGLASTVTGGDDVRWWAGDTFANRATAPSRIHESGEAFFEKITVANPGDNSSVQVAGTLTSRQDFTAGFDITQGEVVAIEADGMVYPSRITDSGVIVDTDENLDSVGRTGDSASVSISDTIAFSAFFNTSNMVGQRVTYNIDSDTITAVGAATTTISTGTANPALAPISSTTCLLATEITGSTTVRLRFISGLDSGITLGTEINADTDAITPALVKVDATHALLLYEENSSNDLKLRVVTITGTNVAVGAEQAFHTGTDTLYGVTRYGTSEYYAALFDDGTDLKVLTFQWDGVTLTLGSAVTVTSSAHGVGQLASLTDSMLGLGVLVGTDVKAYAITRAGTVTTVNTGANVATGASSNSAATIGLGADSFVIFFCDTASTVSHSICVRILGTTPSAIGSELEVFTSLNTPPWNGSVMKVASHLLLFASEDTDEDQVYSLVRLGSNFESVIGIAAENIATSAVGGVVLAAYCDDVTGLAPATKYFVGIDGAIVTASQGGTIQLGIGLSATEIKVTI